MLKRFTPLWLLTALAVLLAACTGAGATPAVSTAPATKAAVTEAATSATQPGQVSAPPGCTVTSPRPTPGPTEEALFPSVSDQDWVQGPDDAYVTIVEYGDFQ